MNTAELMKLLRAKYAPPEYALFTNVSNGTGSRADRWADALCMGIWPSRGLTLHGFELKVSRGDWLKELATPTKAESICRYCDHWSVVAGGNDIVRDGELPSTWGLIAHNGHGLKVVKPAPAFPSPAPINRTFLAAICRRAVEQGVDAAALKAARDAGYTDGAASEKHTASYEARRTESELKELREKLAAFESASGITIDRWTYDTKSIGAAVKLLVNSDPRREFENLATSAERIAKHARETIAALNSNVTDTH